MDTKEVWVVIHKHYDDELDATVFDQEELAYGHAAKEVYLAACGIDDLHPGIAFDLSELIKAKKYKEALDLYTDKVVLNLDACEEVEVVKKTILSEKIHSDDVTKDESNGEES